ncbi:hypothetical protein K4F52_005959 [Lecanicillium sp. MT-2017a]|nr:hypothetical protein K4F52_005959 [Lecanicillium sp. MT-2017a]
MKFTTTISILTAATSVLAAPTGCVQARQIAKVDADVNTDGLVEKVPLLGPLLADLINGLNLGSLPVAGGVADDVTDAITRREQEEQS